MLIIHFLGLAMGLGTSFGFMFLGIAASKLPKEEAVKFSGHTFSLSKMGTIGITLLVLSGGYLMTPFWSTLSERPLLMIKLILVAVLICLIIMLNLTMNKAKRGDFLTHLKRIQMLGRISMITAISIVILAVFNFR